GRDGRALASGGGDGSVGLWGLRGGGLLGGWEAGGRVTAVAFAPDGKSLFGQVGSGVGVRQWDSTGKPLRRWRWAPGDVGCLAAGRDGRTLAAGSGNVVRLVDLGTGRERLTFPDIEGYVKQVAVARGGAGAGVTEAGRASVWPAGPRGRRPGPPRRLPPRSGERGYAAGAAFAPDGRLLAVAREGEEAVVELWTPDAGR